MKQVLPILVALILAAVAAVGIVQYTKSVGAGGAVQNVVVAERDLTQGTMLKRVDMRPRRISRPTGGDADLWKFVFQDFTDPGNTGQLEGRVLNKDLAAGEPILTSSLAPLQEFRMVGSWKDAIKPKKRAISIPVERVGSVSGLIDVGDHVDILVTIGVPQKDEGAEKTITMPVRMGQTTQNITLPYSQEPPKEWTSFYLMQDVEILAVGALTTRPEQLENAGDPLAALLEARPSGEGYTVAVSPEEALRFAFVISAAEAKFSLTLRSPKDTEIVDTDTVKPVTYNEVLKAVGIMK